MYNDKVIEVFKNPKNVGEAENYNAIGTVGNENCGDIMQITMRIEDDIIKDAKFKTFGCAAAVASSSVATDMIIGKPWTRRLQSKTKTSSKRSKGCRPRKFIVPCLRKRQSNSQ